MVLLLPRRARGSASLPSGAVFTDNFNRSNAALAGTDWTTDTNSNIRIVSNEVTNVGTPNIDATYSRAYARCNTSMASTSHYAQAVVSASTTLPVVAVAVAMNDPATETWVNAEMYWCGSTGGGGGTWSLYKVTSGGTETLVDSLVEAPPAKPYTIKLVKTGADLELFVNGVSKLTYTDPSPLSHTHAGFMVNRDNSVTYIDDFEAGRP